MASLIDQYVPRWLYLQEFLDALPGHNLADKQDAVLLLIRDRLIVDAVLDEKHFRFLAGKPSIVDAMWLVNLSHSEVDWEKSAILAHLDPGNFPDTQWFLIEIATAALSLFGSRSTAGTSKARRTPPELTRAKGALEKIFGSEIPGPKEMTGPDLWNTVNRHQEKKGMRLFAKDSVLRAAGRRPPPTERRK
jgi:hypothetical protein